MNEAINSDQPPAASPLLQGSDDVLRRVLARMEESDAAEAPELAAAIAAELSARLEGTPISDEVRQTLTSASAEGELP